MQQNYGCDILRLGKALILAPQFSPLLKRLLGLLIGRSGARDLLGAGFDHCAGLFVGGFEVGAPG